MKSIIVLFITQLFIGAAFAQAGFKVILEKIDLVFYNKDYMEAPVVVIFQYNETHQGINGSGKLLQDLGMDLKDNIEVFQIEKGEPHLMTTAKDVNICELMTGGFPEIEELIKFGNITKCPILKGTYGASNAVLDLSNIPPSIPRGKFMLDIRTYNGETEILRTKSYLLVEDLPAKKSK